MDTVSGGISTSPPPPHPPPPPPAKSVTVSSSSSRSVLDKPLHELTEDDISLITREDCRRYLQEKGMRRPSWNKSQAIQQVISLKSLLEPPPPPTAGFGTKRPASAPEIAPRAAVNSENSNSCSSLKELSTADMEVSVSVPESSTSGLECPKPNVVDEKALSQRSLETTDLPLEHMTIFYSGKVNVYEGVPPDRAQTILHLAASPFPFSPDEQTSGPSAQWANPVQLHPSNSKFDVIHPDPALSSPIEGGSLAEYVPELGQEGNVFRELDVDSQANRQVSLQKYREKKRDRERSKGIDRVGPPGLDLYLSHHVRAHCMNGHSVVSSTNSPNRPRQPYLLHNLVRSSKNPEFSVETSNKV